MSSSMGRKYKYNNEWIFEHYDPDGNWHTVLAEYNKTFGTDIKYPTFVSHMNRELKLIFDKYHLSLNITEDYRMTDIVYLPKNEGDTEVSQDFLKKRWKGRIY